LLTTSREPTKNMRTLSRDISYTFPNIMRINRGKLSRERLVEKVIELNGEKMIIIERWNEGIGKMEFFEVKQDNMVSVPPIIYVHSVKFRRDFERQMSKGKMLKSIAIATFSNRNFVKKVEDAFANFFKIPVISYEEAINSKHDAVMQILSDSANSTSITFRLVPDFIDFGPQLGITHLVWKPE